MSALPSFQTRQYVQDLMARYHIKARTSIGQHYLVNDTILERIIQASGITGDSTVVEVGAGIGNLTTRLAEVARRVIAIELDETFRALHDKMAEAYPNLSFHYGDALDFDWDGAAVPREGDLAVVGNIPYQITTPLIVRLLRARVAWRAILFMTQREVAERICAPVPGNKTWGAISLKTALLCEREILFPVSAREFMPMPRVESAVIRLTRTPAPPIDEPARRARFYTMVDGLFQRRRKMAPNSLAEASAFGLGRDQWTTLLRQAGLDPARRGETFTLEEAVTLFQVAERAATP